MPAGGARYIVTSLYPIFNADTANLDDWLFVYNEMHVNLANLLNLDNPFQLLDSDLRVEEDFYDWIGVHQTIHEQIAKQLGV